ncbi:MAG: hypothetical protein LWX23_07705 [Spirochaetia bacterium]|nr:hypothetical protein [Spirochaetia bacterium]MCE1209339.1 hypothetical protein [Spirochaetia bacterium]
MRLGLCQVDSQWENRIRTRERIAKIFDAWDSRVDCLIFPEMGLSGFSMNRKATSLDMDDHEFFFEIASRLKTIVLYGGVEKGFNCIFSVDSRGVRKTEYRKRHLFSYGDEDKSYLGGTDSALVDICGMKFALAICYDLRFPYHFWENAKAVDGFIVIASWPENRREHWSSLLRARAIENLAYVVGVNRVGKDPALSYSGDSAVYGPFGERHLECGPSEGVFCCEINPSRTAEIRAAYHFIEDRKQ